MSLIPDLQCAAYVKISLEVASVTFLVWDMLITLDIEVSFLVVTVAVDLSRMISKFPLNTLKSD